MSTTDVGRYAEDAVTDYLHNQQYQIIDRNWKTRWCEVDIIAQKHQAIFFIEVKYRKSDQWGDGLAYITKAKLRQMEFAANLYMADKATVSYSLACAAVTGTEYVVTDFIVL